MSSFLNALAGKFSSEQRKDLSDGLNVSWEVDKNVRFCRGCEKEFGTMLRKHHCRGCGGIFCEKCTHNNVELPDLEDRVRACAGCFQGETPGDRVRKIAKEMEASVGEETFAVSQVRLQHGTLYGEETDAFQRSDGARAHPAGYFELTNKSEEVIAVRVSEGTVNPFYECSRPSYIAVLPFEHIHGCYDPTLTSLEISILMNNPEFMDPSSPVIIDTKQNRAEDISPCAKIVNFQDFCLYRTKCTLKNCIVKFKGAQQLEVRTGSSSKVKKMFSFNKKSSANMAIMDFETNVDGVERHYSSRAVKLT